MTEHQHSGAAGGRIEIARPNWMSEVLLYYKRPDPTTWVYMSSFLTVGLFFAFHRFWSIRNLDVVLLILLAPGLLMVYEGRRRQLLVAEVAEMQSRNQQPGRPPNRMSRRNEPGQRELRRFGPLVGSLPIFALMQNTSSDIAEQASRSEANDEIGINESSAIIDGNADAIETKREEPLDSDELPSDPGEDPANASDDPETGMGETGMGETGMDETGMDTASPPQALQTDDRLIESRYDPLDIQRWGFIYLFMVESLILLRLMLDPLMVRRPLLDPNLTSGGLNFIGISLFVFMMANVVTSSPRVQAEQGPELGPGYTLMNMLPAIPTRPDSESPEKKSAEKKSPEKKSEEKNSAENKPAENTPAESESPKSELSDRTPSQGASPGNAVPPTVDEMTPQQLRLTRIAKGLAILAQLMILLGIVLISSRHFGNLRAGFGCATLYLLLPYTAQMTGRVDHALPAALLLMAVLCYRRPLLAGAFLGLAGGLVYYPLFLLPLWVSFYWQRGVRSFAIGVASMLFMLVLVLAIDESASLQTDLQRMFGLLNPYRDASEFRGIWALGWNPIWRLPVIVAFVILSAFFAIWPAQKNLGNLISGSAALMAAAQFWHGYGGGLYIAWFLPLLLLTIFRPNLQDRVATKVVITRSPEPRKSSLSVDRAELEPA